MSDQRSILEKFCKNNNCGDCIYMRYLWDSLATYLWQESAEQFNQSKGVNLFPQSNLKKYITSILPGIQLAYTVAKQSFVHSKLMRQISFQVLPFCTGSFSLIIANHKRLNSIALKIQLALRIQTPLGEIRLSFISYLSFGHW